MEKMKVTVRLFAAAKQYAGAESIQVELNGANPTVAELRNAVVRAIPDLEPLNNYLRFSVNADYASDETAVAETDELACIPPVSGG